MGANTFAVGNFTKVTTAAPVTQAVPHGLGETPKAVIIWTDGQTGSAITAGYRFGLGFTDGTNERAVGISSADAANPTGTARRIATKSITIVDSGGTTSAEADMQSLDDTNFTLSWSTNNGSAYRLHFIAIGGRNVQAKVIGWTMKTSTGTQAVTGVGFKPSVVINLNAGSGFTTAPSSTSSNAGFGLSVMDASGGQWATSVFSTDGASTTDTSRYQRTDQCLVTTGGSQSKAKEASFTSMDSDGFTIDYSTSSTSASQVVSLALKGVSASAGSFNKATGAAPASQQVTGVSFTPRVLMLASVFNTTNANVVQHHRFGFGAGTPTVFSSSGFQDTDAISPSSTDGIDRNIKISEKINNNSQTNDAEADVTSLDTDGFTLSWTVNDAVATEYVYLALGERRVVVVGSPHQPDRGRRLVRASATP